MKNINYVINGVLAVAVIILFVMHFTGNKESKIERTFAASDSSSVMPVAYVNIDSLLSNYNYSKDLNEVILRKQENSRASVTQRARNLQTEMDEFQRKVDNNAFLTRERAQQEQQRLLNKQQELQNFDNQLAQELMQEQQNLTEQLRDTLVSQLKDFNKKFHYQIIFGNTSGSNNIFIANDAYDITNEFLEYLNKNYSSPNK